jgi:hypothetical protein
MAALDAQHPILPREPEYRSRCCRAAPSTTHDIKAALRRAALLAMTLPP